MNQLYNNFLSSIKNKKIMICGLGLSNSELIKMFHNAGAKVIACDARNESEIPIQTINYIKSEKIELRLGDKYLDTLDCDILIRTPGMKFLSKPIQKAKSLGIIVTSEMEIFFDLCPCKIIAVTGSDGKTTVTTIISEILKNSGKKVFVGGNIGLPLLPRINDICENDIVVAELSSFQLISMRKSPNIAVITNISPNHLDVHKDMDEYVNSKKNIVLHQSAFGRAVLNYDNDITKETANDIVSSPIFFSRKQKLSTGVWINENNEIIYSKNSVDTKIMKINDIKIKGNHNLENYLAAIAAVWDIVNLESIKQTALEFSGVEHRMEFVRNINGISYYNDSIATSPTRVISGCLSLFEQKIIIIAGGYDKKIPFEHLGDILSLKTKLVILLGQTADKIESSIKNSQNYSTNNPKIIKTSHMEEAVKQATLNATEGDIVVLSPACASFGMYKNFEDRGKHFKNIVNGIERE